MTRPGCTVGIEPNGIDIKTTFYLGMCTPIRSEKLSVDYVVIQMTD